MIWNNVALTQFPLREVYNAHVTDRYSFGTTGNDILLLNFTRCMKSGTYPFSKSTGCLIVLDLYLYMYYCSRKESNLSTISDCSLHLNAFLLVFVGHLCDLQDLFWDIDNLRTVNRIELQLMSPWRHDITWRRVLANRHQ